MKDAAKGIINEYNIERDDGQLDSLQVSDYVVPILEWDESERLGIQKRPDGKFQESTREKVLHM